MKRISALLMTCVFGLLSPLDCQYTVRSFRTGGVELFESIDGNNNNSLNLFAHRLYDDTFFNPNGKLTFNNQFD